MTPRHDEMAPHREAQALLFALRTRLRITTERRADLVWSELVGELRQMADAAARSLLGACEDHAALARLHAHVRRELQWSIPANDDGGGCVEVLALQCLVARWRGVLADAGAELAGEAIGQATPGEMRALEALRRFRLDVRALVARRKASLWDTVARSAVRAADALGQRLEDTTSGPERRVLRARLARAVAETTERTGAMDDLALFAELLAAKRLLAVLEADGRPRAHAQA